MGHIVAAARVHEWIADFVLEYSDKKVWERDAVVRKWFGEDRRG